MLKRMNTPKAVNEPSTQMPVLMRFDELALGARFTFAASGAKKPTVWIKLCGDGCGKVAVFDEKRISQKNWIGQGVCAAKDNDNDECLVNFYA